MDRLYQILNGITEAMASKTAINTNKKIAMYPEDTTTDEPINKTTLLNNDDQDIPNPIDEDVMEGNCKSSDDNESLQMAIASLKNIVSNVNAIIDHVSDSRVQSNLTEAWVLATIAVVDDNISSVHDYVKFSESEDDILQASKKSGLWENIRKKKEREGKDYKPAKPGDEDRPDPSMWKKLTK
jgi:hypothetical protein